MNSTKEEIGHQNTEIATGARPDEPVQIVPFLFDRYEIMVKVTPSGQFLGISEIRVNRDFLSQAQRLGATSHQDVDEFYRPNE
jgi:hypothetical protein